MLSLKEIPFSCNDNGCRNIIYRNTEFQLNSMIKALKFGII